MSVCMCWTASGLRERQRLKKTNNDEKREKVENAMWTIFFEVDRAHTLTFFFACHKVFFALHFSLPHSRFLFFPHNCFHAFSEAAISRAQQIVVAVEWVENVHYFLCSACERIQFAHFIFDTVFFSRFSLSLLLVFEPLTLHFSLFSVSNFIVDGDVTEKNCLYARSKCDTENEANGSRSTHGQISWIYGIKQDEKYAFLLQFILACIEQFIWLYFMFGFFVASTDWIVEDFDNDTMPRINPIFSSFLKL